MSGDDLLLGALAHAAPASATRSGSRRSTMKSSRSTCHPRSRPPRPRSAAASSSCQNTARRVAPAAEVLVEIAPRRPPSDSSADGALEDDRVQRPDLRRATACEHRAERPTARRRPPARERLEREGECRPGVETQSLVVAGAGAADHDLVLLDRDLDGPVARPVLRVDRVVGDGRVEPEPVALLAVVERRLDRRRRRRSCGASDRRGASGAGAAWLRPRRRPSSSPSDPAASASASWPGAASAASSSAAIARVVLGAQVDLVVEVGAGGAPRV